MGLVDSGASFNPEKTHIELACSGPAVGAPVPVTSPAKATLALAPEMATAKTAAVVGMVDHVMLRVSLTLLVCKAVGSHSPDVGNPRGGKAPWMHRPPCHQGVRHREAADAPMNKTHNQRAHRRHATAEPFPIWFKISFALVVGGLALLAAVGVAVLTVT